LGKCSVICAIQKRETKGKIFTVSQEREDDPKKPQEKRKSVKKGKKKAKNTQKLGVFGYNRDQKSKG